MENITIMFTNTEDLKNQLLKMIGKEDNIHKAILKNTVDNWAYKFLSAKIKEELPRGIQLWEYEFVASLESYIYASIRIHTKNRYIKTKDKMILKDIEKVEIY